MMLGDVIAVEAGAIERDLRSKYGADCRVIGSDSPEEALNLLKQLTVRNERARSFAL